ncbi:hypothetical protein [Desmospora profundinema]|uniref:Lipoprotein n=1 Tax=Desmospora profundinema TaxID=1571184 RepID=A0ABU1IM07_9BACL|nr:hypothetical protein [Desmospora profundinema]MDR6225592.1 hypothetical protein [Desmospora profundinema]
MDYEKGESIGTMEQRQGMEGEGFNRTGKVVALFAVAALVAVPGCSSAKPSQSNCVDRNKDGYCDDVYCVDNDEDGYCDDGTGRAGGGTYYSGGNRYYQKESGVTKGTKGGSKGGIGKSSSSGGFFSGG